MAQVSVSVQRLDRNEDRIVGTARRLRRSDLPAGTLALARYLLGKLLLHELPGGIVAGGRIVETEAYPTGDSAGHAFVGLRPRHRSLYLEPGHAYVYTMHRSNLVNVSSERDGIGAGVLLRALEPLAGVDAMRSHRPASTLRDVARGPGRLAAALGVDKRYDGIDLCAPRSALWLAGLDEAPPRIGRSARIGVTSAHARLLRFYVRGNAFVSGPRWLSPP